MNRRFEEKLRGLSEAEIERALGELCQPFGGIRSLSFSQDKSGGQVCFIELAVAENLTRLYSVLNGMTFGDRFVIHIKQVAQNADVGSARGVGSAAG